jgi:predicted dinucleotide-utilizing enzyme
MLKEDSKYKEWLATTALKDLVVSAAESNRDVILISVSGISSKKYRHLYNSR